MPDEPLESLAGYSHLAAEISERPLVERSTLSVWSTSPYTGTVEGEIFFCKGFRLRIREEIDFASGVPSLAPTHPHHKHVPPDIKRNRIPALGIGFDRPNLPFVVQELEDMIEKETRDHEDP